MWDMEGLTGDVRVSKNLILEVRGLTNSVQHIKYHNIYLES